MNKIFTKVFYTVSVIIFFLATSIPVSAQLLNSTVETGKLYSALTKDASNNIYVIRVKAGSGGVLGEVVKYNAAGDSSKVIYTGLHEGDDAGPGGDLPWGLAVTGTGDVYVSTDFAVGGGNIIKLKFASGTYTASTFQSGAYYTALAVDAANNLYATQYDGSTHYAIYKYAANSANGAAGVKLYGNLKQGAGYSYPTGMAVAANGDIYVTDAFTQDPTLTADGGHVYKITAASSYSTAVAVSTSHYASALTLDAAGNLYTAENTGTDANGYKLLKYTNGGGTPTVLYTPLHTNGIYYPYGIAVLSNNSIYAIDGDNGTTGGAVDHLTPPSPDANLAYISLGHGTLNPVFSAAVTNYTASVASNVSSMTVKPITDNAGATVKVNGTTVVSNTPSGPITLNTGINVITFAVTAQDGITTKTYTVNVTRLSTDANLSNLTLSNGTLTPVFAKATVNYTATVLNGISSVTITPVTDDASATVTVNGTAVLSGTASGSVPLVVGANAIPVVVTATDGTTKLTYTVTVTRTGSPDANLAYISLGHGTLSPVFSEPVISYTATVANNVSSMVVKPITDDAGATVTVNGIPVASNTPSGAITLNVGSNIITFAVTAADGVTKKTYTVTVTRVSTDANLAYISLGHGTLSPAFSETVTSYTASVAANVSSMIVKPITDNAGATVTVNGTAVASNTPSGPITLNTGLNAITFVVTAQDGTTKKTYTVNVTRGASVDANLSYISLGHGTLTPVFSEAVTNYTAEVANNVSSMFVKPTTDDPYATVTVNGTAVPSGTPTSSIPLNVGKTSITFVVTAPDGVTMQTYTVVVTRDAPPPLNGVYESVSVLNPQMNPNLNSDGITVHEGVSPNGDGLNDYLVIDGITAYSDNSITIMSRSGALVFEAKSYDNSTVVFDGHSNKNGRLQQAGTYFYSLDYKVGDEVKHKTGYIILKY